MRPEELLLQHQRLAIRLRAVATETQAIEATLESSPELERLEAELEAARSRQAEVAARVRAADQDAEDHRGRLRTREKELMSGRIHQPSELTKLSAEVDHLRARLGEEEEGELALMQEAEERDAEVSRIAASVADLHAGREAEAPAALARLGGLRSEAAELEGASAAVWEQISAPLQAAYQRVRAWPPVAEVAGSQCGGCRVGLTANQLQQVRRGGLVACQTCSRLLVAT